MNNSQGDNIGKKLINTVDTTERKVLAAQQTPQALAAQQALAEQNVKTLLRVPRKIGKTIRVSTKAMRIILTNKAVRDEIIGIVRSLTELAKKSIEEAGETVFKDKVFMDNLMNTSRKIGTQLATTVYSTIDGLTLGTVGDIQAIYSSFLASLNAINLLSSILKLPLVKIEEKINGDSKDIVELIDSLKRIRNNYETLLQRLDDKYDAMKLRGDATWANIDRNNTLNKMVNNNAVVGGGGGYSKKNKRYKKVMATKNKNRHGKNTTKVKTLKRKNKKM